MKVVFTMSEAAIKNALLSGVEIKSEQSIDVNLETLSESERALLLEACSFSPGCLRLQYSVNSTADLQGVLKKCEELKKEWDDKKTRDAQDELKQRAALSKNAIDNLALFIANERCELNTYDSYFCMVDKDCNKFFNSTVSLFDGVKNTIKRAGAGVESAQMAMDELQRRNEVAATLEAEAAAAKAARNEKIAVGNEEMKEWAKEEGSELLLKRMNAGFEFVELLRKEWTGANTPIDFDAEERDFSAEEITAPELDELLEYEEALDFCSKSEGLLSNPKLLELTISDEYEEDETKRVLAISITAPDLTKCRVFKTL